MDEFSVSLAQGGRAGQVKILDVNMFLLLPGLERETHKRKAIGIGAAR
jgi:hypothetical protein